MPDLDPTRPHNPASDVPIYLILMTEVFIAQDLALTIKEHEPTAIVMIAITAAQAVMMIDSHATLAVAFLCEQPTRFGSSELARAIAARGGHVVLLGEEAEMIGPTNGWDVLERPFSTETVMAHLARN